MSTTTDIWTAYTYSGGWDKPGTILEIELSGVLRGADLSFLSVFPREREITFPPVSADATAVDNANAHAAWLCTCTCTCAHASHVYTAT